MDSAKKFGKSILRSSNIDIGMKSDVKENKESKREIEDLLKGIFSKYRSDRKITNKDRARVGKIIDGAIKKSGKSMGQQIMEMRGYDKDEISRYFSNS